VARLLAVLDVLSAAARWPWRFHLELEGDESVNILTWFLAAGRKNVGPNPAEAKGKPAKALSGPGPAAEVRLSSRSRRDLCIH
jgi:hypothetical protein